MSPCRCRFAGPAPFSILLVALLAAAWPAGSAAIQDPPAEEPPSATSSAEPAPEAALGPDSGDPAAAGRARLAEVHHYLSRDGGRWRAKNPAHAPGAPTPAHFGYEFDWVLDGTAVAARIFGVLEDGTEETLWRALTSWHPGERAVVIHSLSRDGDVSRGVYEVIDAEHHRLHLTITAPSGDSFQIRDDMEILGPDRFESTTLMRRDGEWVVLEGQDWHRVKSGA